MFGTENFGLYSLSIHILMYFGWPELNYLNLKSMILKVMTINKRSRNDLINWFLYLPRNNFILTLKKYHVYIRKYFIRIHFLSCTVWCHKASNISHNINNKKPMQDQINNSPEFILKFLKINKMQNSKINKYKPSNNRNQNSWMDQITREKTFNNE